MSIRMELEKIFETDEDAPRKLEAAMEEAEAIACRASRQAAEILEEMERSLASSLEEERERILGEAKSRSDELLSEADGCIQRLRTRKEALMDVLVERFFRKLTSP